MEGSVDSTNSKSISFIELSKGQQNKNSVWFHFLRAENGQLAKCKNDKCEKVLKMGGGSTSALRRHLDKIHGIKLAEETAITNPHKNASATSSTKMKKMDAYFKAKGASTLAETIARMTSKDGLAFSVFCTSEDLRKAIKSMGFSDQLPKSAPSIRAIVVKYAVQLREAQKSEIIAKRDRGQKFCVIFDEWTSSKNRRFMNLIIRGKETDTWNLGLIRIKGSMTAEIGLQMVKDRLNCYNLNMGMHIVSIVTDGTSVMTKIGMLSPTFQQLCLAHGIQLAVTDVLYKKLTPNSNNNQSTELTGNESDVDSEDDNAEFRNDPTNKETTISHTSIGPIIQKVRNIVKLFKRSPLKNENLQKHVTADFGKELQLILDSKTRWNSLCDMLERFYKLRFCILKALIDVHSDIQIEDSELIGICNLTDALAPLKATVEVLCRRDANLLTADAALNFAISKLEELESPIGQELAVSFRTRIMERRTDISSVLQYLHSGKVTMDEEYDEDLFQLPTKQRIATILKNLLARMSCANREAQPDGSAETTEFEDMTEEVPSQPKKKKSDLQDELNKVLKTIDSRSHSEKCQPENTLLATIKKEMGLFEAGGARGHHLQLAYEFLKTIPPTSVESERAFSAAGYLCNKVRSSFRDDTLDDLCFLRSHFQTNT